MDYFKSCSFKMIGISGRRCPCCFIFRGYRRRKVNGFNKIVRSIIKRNDRVEVFNALDDLEYFNKVRII